MPGDLQNRFAAASDRLKADFMATASTHHPGSRGTEREEILARFLELYLPRSVEVIHNAEILSASGGVSRQCDIVIADNRVPRLQDLESHRIVPIESVYCVIEVKSRLDGPELKKALSNIAEVKKLKRDAFLKLRGGFQPFAQPVFGGVFAYDSIKLETVTARFIEYCDTMSSEHHANGVWIFKTGMVVWGSTDGLGSWFNYIDARPNREVRTLVGNQEGDILLAFILTISSLMIAQLPPLDMHEYLSRGKYWWVKGRSRWTPNGVRNGDPSSWL